jgi:hypothetical protein
MVEEGRILAGRYTERIMQTACGAMTTSASGPRERRKIRRTLGMVGKGVANVRLDVVQ